MNHTGCKEAATERTPNPTLNKLKGDVMTILVVEDEPPIRELLIDILTDEGYPVATASNGMQALNFLRQSEELPKLILLDMMMPMMDGWTFRKEQMQDLALSQVPVVILSAARDLQKHAAALNVAGCLEKPVDITELLGVVGHNYPP
jgi:CheY-like chemotaxis protein